LVTARPPLSNPGIRSRARSFEICDPDDFIDAVCLDRRSVAVIVLGQHGNQQVNSSLYPDWLCLDLNSSLAELAAARMDGLAFPAAAGAQRQSTSEGYTSRMDNSAACIGALKRYVALLQNEERRLTRAKSSPHATEQERADACATLRTASDKISNAEREIFTLQEKRLFNQRPQGRDL
jgi:hypothetical protein